MINRQQIVDKIQAALDTSTQYNSEDVVALALAIITMQETANIITVPTKYDLPDLTVITTIADGAIYYITNLDIHAIKYGSTWITFDGRVIDNSLVRTAQAWGRGTWGMLGDGTNTYSSSPVSVVGGFTDWCQVSSSANQTLAVRSNGTAWGWGWNNSYELGIGITGNQNSPVSVIGGFTDWCQVSAGGLHGLGLRSNGTAWGWGWNSNGEAGDCTITPRSSPVSVVGGFTDWCQIAAGSGHSLGVRTNGTLWAWGTNNCGQVGDGTKVNKSSPVSVSGGFTDWCQVSAGYWHSVGLRTNGTLWSWGGNSYSQLGDGSYVNASSPVSIVGGFTDWVDVSAGGNHSAGVRSNGTAWGWGQNNYGQSGNNTSSNNPSPVSVVGGFTNWCQVGAGTFHTLGVRTNGTAWAWGQNVYGQLGDGTTTSRSSPVTVTGGFTDWCQVSAGTSHSTAIRVTQNI